MDKRLVLAIALSLLIMLSWSALVNKTQPIDNKQVTQSIVLNANSASSVVVPVPALPPKEAVKEFVSFKQDNREIIFDVAKAAIAEVIFKVKLDHSLPLVDGFYSDGNNLFKLEKISQDSVSFVYQDRNKQIFKEFHFPKDSYSIELKIQTRNLSSSPLILTPRLTLGVLDLSPKNPQLRYYGVFMGGGEKNRHLGAGKEFTSQDVKYIGLRDQYFCAIVEPVGEASNGYIRKLNAQGSEVGIQEREINLKPGDQIGQLYRIYLGPQDSKTISNIKPGWSAIIYYGTFDFIAQLLLQLLGFFYSLVHNWGLAIIILSLVVYLALFPLTLKQMRSMKEMQLLQPKIEALRNELKNNPQRLNKEIMELYKEHKVNPLGGCLPLLLQMPIFFALYQALIRSVALRGAKFLWIKDLSAPDHFFTLKNSIPFLGNQINILPILMAIGMFVQQKISMAKASGEAAQQQKMMTIIMPIMFGVIFYQMPSGLVLYWFVNSALMLTYQFRVNSQK